MRVATTITHYFEIPFNVSAINLAEISYEQDEKVILVKDNSECILNGNMVSCKLSQEDTLKFDFSLPLKPIFVQLRVALKDGNVLGTELFPVKLKPTINKVVL